MFQMFAFFADLIIGTLQYFVPWRSQKNSAAWPWPWSSQLAWIQLWPGPNLSPFLARGRRVVGDPEATLSKILFQYLTKRILFSILTLPKLWVLLMEWIQQCFPQKIKSHYEMFEIRWFWHVLLVPKIWLIWKTKWLLEIQAKFMDISFYQQI